MVNGQDRSTPPITPQPYDLASYGPDSNLVKTRIYRPIPDEGLGSAAREWDTPYLIAADN
jgi:hypothetical protein